MPKRIRCFLFLLLPLFGYAQFEPVQSFSVKDGLPSSVVYDCLQDKQGFMWFATAAGLARFDGTNYKVFTTQDGITNNEVLQILQDKDGSIWIVPYGNVPCIYDPATSKILNYKNYPELNKFLPFTENIFLRHSAMGLISHISDQMITLADKKVTITKIKSLIDLWPVNKDSAILFFDQQDEYIFLSRGQFTKPVHPVTPVPSGFFFKNGDWGNIKLFYAAGKTYRLSVYNFLDNKKIVAGGSYSNNYPINSVQKFDSLFYINTPDGVIITDLSLKVKQHIFSGKNISKSFIDRDGNEWFTTLSGDGVLLRMKNKLKQFSMKNGLPDENVSRISFGAGNNLYCGDNKGNIYLLNPKASGISIKPLTRFSDIARDILFEDNNLIAFSNEQLFIDGKKHQLLFSIKSVMPYDNRYLLIGGSKDLVKWNRKTGERIFIRHSGLFRSLCRYAGKIFYGNNNGLFCINSIEPYTEEPVLAGNRPFREPVNHIIITRDSIMWVATNTNGLYALRNGKMLAQFYSGSGRQQLNSNTCKKLYADDSTHTIWIATNKGINRVSYTLSGDILRSTVASITSSDGLNDDDVNDVFVKEGLVYAATIKGICVLPVNLRLHEIPMVISDIAIKDYNASGNAGLLHNYRLKYWQNNISISYAGILFTGSKRPEYEYRFFREGGDTLWTRTTATTVEFRELPPGNHIFQVTSATGDIKEIKFHIETPYWKTTWFYLFLFLALTALMTWITSLISKNIKRKEAEKTAVNKRFAELELQALQAQMNPHFVFNAMNTLQNYILKQESDNASEYLSRFSGLMRLFLDASRNKFITLANEKELLRNYIALEQARLDHSFSFEIHSDEMLEPETEIPSVLIQPFVENAILHGLRHREDKNGRLDIYFSANGNSIVCRITDNGVGREEAGKIRKAKGSIYKSQGMQLIEDKIRTLKAIKNIDIEISIRNLHAGGENPGTEVIILFSNINKNDAHYRSDR